MVHRSEYDLDINKEKASPPPHPNYRCVRMIVNTTQRQGVTKVIAIDRIDELTEREDGQWEVEAHGLKALYCISADQAEHLIECMRSKGIPGRPEEL